LKARALLRENELIPEVSSDHVRFILRISWRKAGRMLPGTRRQPSLWGFANFVFDRGADQLYKDGERLHLQGKPLLLLRILLEQSGNLVTREDLRQRLWPDEQSLESMPA